MGENELDPEVQRIIDEAKRLRKERPVTYISTESGNEDKDPISNTWIIHSEEKNEAGKVVKRIYNPQAGDGRLIVKDVDAQGNESVRFTVQYPEE